MRRRIDARTSQESSTCTVTDDIFFERRNAPQSCTDRTVFYRTFLISAAVSLVPEIQCFAAAQKPFFARACSFKPVGAW